MAFESPKKCGGFLQEATSDPRGRPTFRNAGLSAPIPLAALGGCTQTFATRQELLIRKTVPNAVPCQSSDGGPAISPFSAPWCGNEGDLVQRPRLDYLLEPFGLANSSLASTTPSVNPWV